MASVDGNKVPYPVAWAGWPLTNADFLAYSKSVVRMAGSFDAQEIPVAERLETLRAINARLVDFITESHRSVHTRDIWRLDDCRDRLLNVVCRAAAVLAKAPDTGPFADAAHILDAWFSAHRRDAARRISDETARIDSIRASYMQDATVRAAAETTGVARMIERLFAVNGQLTAAWTARLNDRGTRAIAENGDTTRSLRKAAAAEIVGIFDLVKACAVVRPSAATVEATAKLMTLVTQYKAVASRGGKRSKKPKEEQNEVENDTPQI